MENKKKKGIDVLDDGAVIYLLRILDLLGLECKYTIGSDSENGPLYFRFTFGDEVPEDTCRKISELVRGLQWFNDNRF